MRDEREEVPHEHHAPLLGLSALLYTSIIIDCTVVLLKIWKNINVNKLCTTFFMLGCVEASHGGGDRTSHDGGAGGGRVSAAGPAGEPLAGRHRKALWHLPWFRS